MSCEQIVKDSSTLDTPVPAVTCTIVDFKEFSNSQFNMNQSQNGATESDNEIQIRNQVSGAKDDETRQSLITSDDDTDSSTRLNDLNTHTANNSPNPLPASKSTGPNEHFLKRKFDQSLNDHCSANHNHQQNTKAQKITELEVCTAPSATPFLFTAGAPVMMGDLLDREVTIVKRRNQFYRPALKVINRSPTSITTNATPNPQHPLQYNNNPSFYYSDISSLSSMYYTEMYRTAALEIKKTKLDTDF